MNRVSFCILLITLLLFSLAQAQSLQDVVYLKNGSIVRGIIIEQVPNESLKIQTRDGSVFVYNMKDILKITKERSIGYGGQNLKGEKNPTTAFLLSFVLPGVGQYYNGDVAKGVIQEVLFVGGWVVFFTLGTETKEEYYSDRFGNEINFEYYNVNTDWLWIGLGISIASSLWSMIDAPISATNINKKRQQTYGHLLELNQGKNIIGFDLGSTKKGLGAKLSYHF